MSGAPGGGAGPGGAAAGLLGRSWLYVPADRASMLAGALDREADAVIVDLEDAVLPARRPAARRTVGAWLDGLPPDDPTAVWVRIGAPRGDGAPDGDDLAVAVHPRVAGVVQAKAEDPMSLARLDAALSEREGAVGLDPGKVAVAALVETAGAVLGLRAVASAPRVVRLQLGEADLVASVGMSPAADAGELLPVRLAVVVVTAAAGLLPALGPVERRLRDPEGLRRSSQALRRLGFGGRSAIHPAQVPVINRVFTPSEEEVATATAVLAAAAEAGRAGAGVVVDGDGRMVDEAVLRGARATVRRAEAVAELADRRSPATARARAVGESAGGATRGGGGPR